MRKLAEGVSEDRKYTVGQAVTDFLNFGLPRRSESTVEKLTTLANCHIIPDLGARKARELSADEVDEWLARKAKILSTRSLHDLHSILRRAIARAQKRDKVRRNVALLCEIPEGRPGRPSKSLTFEQAEAILKAAEGTPMRAYIVVSLLTGARTEETRALTWSHVDLAASRTPTRPCRHTSWCGDQFASMATPRPGGLAGPSHSRNGASTR